MTGTRPSASKSTMKENWDPVHRNTGKRDACLRFPCKSCLENNTRTLCTWLVSHRWACPFHHLREILNYLHWQVWQVLLVGRLTTISYMLDASSKGWISHAPLSLCVLIWLCPGQPIWELQEGTESVVGDTPFFHSLMISEVQVWLLEPGLTFPKGKMGIVPLSHNTFGVH